MSIPRHPEVLRFVQRLVATCAALALATACASTGNDGDSQARGGRHGGRHRHGMRAEHFTAFAVNMGTAPGAAPGQTAIVQINIDHWSNRQQRDRLLAALQGGNSPAPQGQQALLDALQSAPVVGTIRTPDALAWDLHYAHQVVEADGSRRIFIATDRIIHFWEEAYQSRSSRYPFMLIELHVDKDGNGEGRMSTATQISAKDGHLELETYASEPVMLEKVHAER